MTPKEKRTFYFQILNDKIEIGRKEILDSITILRRELDETEHRVNERNYAYYSFQHSVQLENEVKAYQNLARLKADLEMHWTLEE